MDSSGSGPEGTPRGLKSGVKNGQFGNFGTASTESLRERTRIFGGFMYPPFFLK